MKYALLALLALILGLNTDMQQDGIWDVFDLGFGLLISATLMIWTKEADNACIHQ